MSSTSLGTRTRNPTNPLASIFRSLIGSLGCRLATWLSTTAACSRFSSGPSTKSRTEPLQKCCEQMTLWIPFKEIESTKMMDILIIWTLFAWTILGFLLLFSIVEMYPAEDCSTPFKIFWMILCGPAAWILSIVFLLVAFTATIRRHRRKKKS